ncbi:MAG TPA: hypothetical protein VEQ65_11070 [Opitutus sp.]|nr:hypothetical protein [Opitutus sp.]
MKTSPVTRLLLLVGLWGLLATLAGAFRLFEQLPPAVVPVLVAALTVGFSTALARVDWLHLAATQLGVRAILSAHLVRFVGFYFLWLQAQGRLPAEFAQRAGWGDIAAASGALVLLLLPDGRSFRRLLLGWNFFGAADLLLAVGTGGWLNVVRPGSMAEMGGLPLTLVPLWLVPVMMGSHIFLVRQHLCAAGSPVAGPAAVARGA